MADPSLVYNRFQPPLTNPIVTAVVNGTTGTTSYTYTVTAVNECGETDGFQVQVTNAPDTLSTSSYVTLSWNSVDRARTYRIYRDSGFMYETSDTTFDDTGAYTPDTSKNPPAYNETSEYKYLLWDSVAIVPGRYSQSAEINELQAILAEKLKRLGDTIFNPGNIVKGCSLALDTSGNATIEEGYVYIAGAVRYAPSATLSIPTTGTYYIGLTTSLRYIDEDDNPYLLDPAQSYPGYGLPGAYRAIIDLTWTYSSDKEDLDGAVWEIKDGKITRYIPAIQYGKLETYIARRDNDFHGTTLIKGYNIKVFPHSTDRDKIAIEIDPGKAYVQGYELISPSKQSLDETIATDLGDTTQEEISPYSGWLYKPDLTPVGAVSQVTIRVKVAETRTVPSTEDSCSWYFDDTGLSLDSILGVWSDSSKSTAYTYSNTDPGCAGRDPNTAQVYLSGSGFALDTGTFTAGDTYYIEYLKNYTATKGVRQKAYNEDTITYSAGTSTYSLTKGDIIDSSRTTVTVVGADGTSYTKGTDYTIDTGRTDTSIGNGSITWIGNTPADGADFIVKYYYWDHPTEGDYVAVDSYISDYSDYNYDDIESPDDIDFRCNGTKPASEKTEIIVSYQPFLSQWAWLVLNMYGEFSLQKGPSSRKPIRPARPQGVLPRYIFYMPAYSQNVQIYEESRYDVKKTYDLNILFDRVDHLEYNVALNILEQEAYSKHTVNPKKAIFTDPFIDASRMANESTAGINGKDGELILKQDFEPVSATWDISNSSNIQVNEKTITLPYTETEYQSQLIWTEDFAQEINPYAYVVPVATVELVPSVDYWVKSDTPWTISTTSTRAIPLGMISVHREDRDQVEDIISRTFNIDRNWLINGRWRGDSYIFTVAGETNSQYQLNNVDIIPILRTRKVVAVIRGCPPDEDNISGTFDGKSVSLSIATQSDLDSVNLNLAPHGSAGTNSGTVKADSDGMVTAVFTIPSNTPAGNRIFEVQSASGLVKGRAKYYGIGEAEHFKHLINHTRNEYVVNVRWIEPPQVIVRTQVIQQTIRQVIYEQPQYYYDYLSWINPDPIAQSFTVGEDVFISSVDLWFYKVPSSSNEGVLVSIMNLVNGEPGYEVYGMTYLSKSEIMSQMGITDTSQYITSPSDSNKVTFTFKDPIYLPPGDYVISVASNTNGYYLYTARMNKQILGNVANSSWSKIGSILRRQPHSGVLFYSYNGTTWTEDQESDLMFRLNRADFSSTSGTLKVGVGAASANYSHFSHILHTTTPSKTDVGTKYSTDESSWSYYEPVLFDPKEGRRDLNRDPISLNKMTSKLYIELDLMTQNSKVSPIIAKDVNFVYVYHYETSSVYWTNETDLGSDTFSNINVWVDRKLNNGSVTYEVSFDSGSTWYSLPVVDTTSLDNGFEEIELGGSVGDITSNAITDASKFTFKFTLNAGSGYEYETPIHKRLRAVVY